MRPRPRQEPARAMHKPGTVCVSGSNTVHRSRHTTLSATNCHTMRTDSATRCRASGRAAAAPWQKPRVASLDRAIQHQTVASYVRSKECVASQKSALSERATARESRREPLHCLVWLNVSGIDRVYFALLESRLSCPQLPPTLAVQPTIRAVCSEFSTVAP